MQRDCDYAWNLQCVATSSWDYPVTGEKKTPKKFPPKPQNKKCKNAVQRLFFKGDGGRWPWLFHLLLFVRWDPLSQVTLVLILRLGMWYCTGEDCHLKAKNVPKAPARPTLSQPFRPCKSSASCASSPAKLTLDSLSCTWWSGACLEQSISLHFQ